jgi:hypothetical protein
MDLIEIKKELYKQKPIANLIFIRKGIAYYDATIEIEENGTLRFRTVFFEIPISDMGDNDFTPDMDTKLLIRWLGENSNV